MKILMKYSIILGTETKVWLEKVIILGGGPNNNPARVITKVDR